MHGFPTSENLKNCARKYIEPESWRPEMRSTWKTLGLSLVLVAVGAWGFHELDGMVAADAGGDPWINAVYCSVITLKAMATLSRGSEVRARCF